MCCDKPLLSFNEKSRALDIILRERILSFLGFLRKIRALICHRLSSLDRSSRYIGNVRESNLSVLESLKLINRLKESCPKDGSEDSKELSDKGP